MLEIFNTLKPFFKDNYRKINVREYSRITKISPPTASKLLNNLNKESILKKELDRSYIFYYANRDNKIFIDLSRIYWYLKLKNSGLLDYLEEKLLNPEIILFGSLSKAEVNENSDIDLAIFTISKKTLNLNKFENILKRKIQLFMFKSQEEIKNKDLLKNVQNGYKIRF